MKAFTNVNATDPARAATLAAEATAAGRVAAFAGGGSDLLALVKEHIVLPDVLINLKTMAGLDQIAETGRGTTIGGLATLSRMAASPVLRDRYAVLAEAAETVATPQIRNVGTLAGNICQRPWCWYFRNGFPCFKAGGNRCFSFAGENEFHAIFGGGPSYIVHPSDTAPALVALDATFHLVGPAGARDVPAGEFFVLPRENAAQETVLGPGEILTSVTLPAPLSRPQPGLRSAYAKIMDREAWTHAVVSVAVVLEMDGEVCRAARVVLGGVAPIPWRVQAAERALEGRPITGQMAAEAGDLAVDGARPLSKNAYKVPLVRSLVRRTILELAARQG
jgi:xanthine dehydrogenase YagS FAD-binding subunit